MADRTLTIRYTGDARGALGAIKQIQDANVGLGDKMRMVGQRVASVGKTLTMGLTLPIAAAGVAAFKMADDYNDATATIQQHIQTMGVGAKRSFTMLSASGKVAFDEVAGSATHVQVSLQGLEDGARKFSLATGVMQADLLNASGKLITFAKVARRGTDFIMEATRAAADLAASGFGDLSSASVMLGKALDNPIKGLTALTRVGVSFSGEQAKMITHLVETGQVAKAQGIILAAVQAQVGGTAKAIADPWDKAKASLADAAIKIGTALAPAVAKLSGYAQQAVQWFSGLSKGTQEWILKVLLAAAALGPLLVVIGKTIGAIGGLVKVGGGMVGFFVKGESGVSTFGKALGGLGSAFGAVKQAASAVFTFLSANPYVLLIAATILIAVLIIKNWDKIKKSVVEALTNIKNVAITVWNAIKAAASAVWNAIVAVVTTEIRIIIGILRTIVSIATGVWNAVKSAGIAVWSGITGAVKNAVGNIIGVLQGLPGKVKGFFAGAATWLYNAGKAILTGLLDGLKSAWTSVTSFIGGIGSWIGDHKGPISRDRKLLVAHGKAIMGGFEAGLRSGFKGVEGFVGGISPSMSIGVAGAGGGGGITVINQISGSVISERDLAEMVRTRLIELGRRNGTTGIS